jgi:hypothetical protein
VEEPWQGIPVKSGYTKEPFKSSMFFYIIKQLFPWQWLDKENQLCQGISSAK